MNLAGGMMAGPGMGNLQAQPGVGGNRAGAPDFNALLNTGGTTAPDRAGAASGVGAARVGTGMGTGMSGNGNIVGDFIRSVNSYETRSAQMRTDFLAGGSTNLHQVMIAGQEAGVAFSLLIEMRNKVLEAYQELLRIQV